MSKDEWLKDGNNSLAQSLANNKIKEDIRKMQSNN